jgi:hypothetical protein
VRPPYLVQTISHKENIMLVSLTVLADIRLLDDDLGDPATGDPLEDRMQQSAREAVANALELSELNGFSHDMEPLTSLQILHVEVAASIPTSATV